MRRFGALTLAGGVALAILQLGPTVSNAQGPDPVRWRSDYPAARREAAETGKPLFLDFGFEGCPWCHKLDNETLREPSVARMLNNSYVPLKIDVMDPVNRRLVQSLRLEGFPTVITASPEGRVTTLQEGFVNARGMRALLARGLKRVEE